MTGRALQAIGEVGGPRCCRRDSFLAIREAVRFTKEKLGVDQKRETESALNLILKNQAGAVQNLSTKIPDSTEGEAFPSSPQRMVRSDRISLETAESIWKGVSQQLNQERQERQKLLEWFWHRWTSCGRQTRKKIFGSEMGCNFLMIFSKCSNFHHNFLTKQSYFLFITEIFFSKEDGYEKKTGNGIAPHLCAYGLSGRDLFCGK